MWYRALPLLTFLLVSLAAQDTELQDRYFGQIFTAMGLSTGAVVADIGTGPRPVHALKMVKLIGPSGKIVCVDIDAKVISQLNESLKAEGATNITAQLGKPNDPILAAQSFDAILVSNTYHEMEEHEAMLDRIRQALKPGGRLVIVEAITTKLRNAPRLEQTAKHAFAPELLDTELRVAGFEIVSKIEPLLVDGSDIRYLIAATPRSTAQ
jgi:ubiquinone/menaquinone biosynthesis C-methylase UbiE